MTRTTLEAQEDPVLPESMSPIERMHAVWELSQEIYAIAGETGGSLPRDQWPVRIIRPSA